MSQANVEVVRAAFDAWNAGDMDGVRDFFDSEIVTRVPEGWPEPGPFVGREAVMRQFLQLRETYDADVIEPISDFIGVGDQVVVRMIWRGVGRGPESSLEWTCIYMVDDGRILGIHYFWNHADALAAVGLSE